MSDTDELVNDIVGQLERAAKANRKLEAQNAKLRQAAQAVVKWRRGTSSYGPEDAIAVKAKDLDALAAALEVDDES